MVFVILAVLGVLTGRFTLSDKEDDSFYQGEAIVTTDSSSVISDAIDTEVPDSVIIVTESEITEAQETEADITESEAEEYIVYTFRTAKLLDDHYEKHGKEMGFASAEEYEAAASDVVNSPDALYKKEKEDNDDIYYIESTNEFVVVSTDGYLRTYFYPDKGKAYFDRQ
ncbi:MAG: hypothetical protein E7505_06365 [Ruminococcus sp.]|nr:hypothetical protein [Ruminococcus sp.]